MTNNLIKVYWEQWKSNFFHTEQKNNDPDKKPALGVIQSVKGMNRKQWIAFIGAYFGIVLEALDFFSTTLSVTTIATEFNVEPSDVTSAITTTTMLRPVGALIFGIMGDKLGRRWPLVIDVILFSVVNLASGFAPNIQTFIALRALFGVIMGAEWGLGTAMAFETLPIEVRGVFSGIYQEGFLNFMAHATQDLYPTYLTTQLGYSNADRTITIIIYNIGAIVGGCLFGGLSNRWGRRLCIALCCVCSASIIPLWTYSANKSVLRFGSFFMQVFVHGGLGCAPAHLGELSPPSLRTTAPGMAFQLGNLASEKHPLRNPDGSIKLDTNGHPIADYAYTQSLLTGVVCAVAFFVAVFMGVSEERNKDYNDKVIEDSRSVNSVPVGPGDIEKSDILEQTDEVVDHAKEKICVQHEEHSNGKIIGDDDLGTTNELARPIN
ncbi:major facilitator superfamily domain-containing protein [Chlamydoabsidia padenii]|nr:major facilitator superfamily domain-containing protein [Chlamydoabsidia padenii]